MELTPDELRRLIEHHTYSSFTVSLHDGWTGERDQTQNKHRCLRFDVVPDNVEAERTDIKIQYMVDGFARKTVTVPLYLLVALPKVIARLEREDHGGTSEKAKDASC